MKNDLPNGWEGKKSARGKQKELPPLDLKKSDNPQPPKGWTWARFGEILSDVKKVYPSENPHKEFTYLDIASIDNSLQKITNPKKYLGKDAPSRARQRIKSGDILFSTVRTYLKNTAIVNESYDGQIASTGFCVIRPSPPINNKYLFFLVQTDAFLSPLNQLQRGTSYPAVRESDVFSQSIPLPPLPEQRRIVSKLEELFSDLDSGVEALKKANAQLKRYRQSVLKSAFEGKLTEEWRKSQKNPEPASKLLERIKEERKKSANGKGKELPPLDTSELPELPKGWAWTSLGTISEINPKLSNETLVDNTEVSFVPMRMVEARTGRFELSITKKYAEVKKGFTQFINGDLIFAKITPCMENGKIAILDNLKNGVGFGSTEFHVIRLAEDSMLRKFLFFYLLQENYRKDAQRNMTGSAGQLRVPTNYMQQSPVPLPPLSEQQKIVEEIEFMFSVADNAEKTIEKSLKEAERLRQSILKKAFAGRLVPQDPTDEPAEKLLERIRQEKMQREDGRKTVKEGKISKSGQRQKLNRNKGKCKNKEGKNK